MSAIPVVDLQTAYLNSVQPQMVLDSTRNGVVIQDNVVPIAANLFQVNLSTGLPRFIVDANNVRGSDASAGSLVLRGTSNADRGTVEFESAINIQDFTPGGLETYAVNFNPVQNFPAAFIGGGMKLGPTIDFANGLFIWEGISATPLITSGVAPAFAAFTLFNALPVLAAGTGATFNPLSSLCLNVGVAIEHDQTGTRTTASNIAVNAGLQARCGGTAATLNMTNMTGLQFGPVFSTTTGNTVNMGTLTGLRCLNPSVALFQPQTGVETMTAYYGIDILAIPFGGNVPKIGLRSDIQQATNSWMLQNTGGAWSDFGDGFAKWNDDAGVIFGTGTDVFIRWNSVQLALEYNTFFGIGNSTVFFRPNGDNSWDFFSINELGLQYNVENISFGTANAAPTLQNWFVNFTAINGRQPNVAGSYSDVLWTAGGSIDINGLTMTEVQAFKVDSPAVLLNGGTIGDLSNMFLDSMPSFGGTRVQALRVLGRERVDGAENRGSFEPAQITSDQNNYQLGQNNNGRTMNLLNTDANRSLTGIDSSFGFAQTGDHIAIYNTGAFDITLTHQDTNSLAANRFICPEGLPYVIHPQRVVWIWYDDTGVDRWLVQSTYGHLERTLHLSGNQFRKGATAPTDITIGTTPTIPALLFDATNELASLYHSLPIDMDLTQDIILRIQFSLAAVEVNNDTCDFTCDYTAPTLAGGAGVAKTSTQVTGQFTAVTGRLAIGDIYTMDITFSAGDATNPLAAAIGIALEIHLTNTTGVGAIHLLDGDFIYTALRS